MKDLGDRMKAYEAVTSFKLTPRSCVIVRVDGKAFHTYTRNFNKPFDLDLRTAMIQAMDFTAKSMQGFKLGYHQSDEASFLLTDFDEEETDGWFDYKLNKIVSITASAFTAAFNSVISYEKVRGQNPGPALFDARAFVVPKDDVANVFVWRQMDWTRNSLSMLARSHFSQAQLHGKRSADVHEMLHSIGVNWNDCEPWQKNGTFLATHGRSWVSEKLDYDSINALAFGGQ